MADGPTLFLGRLDSEADHRRGGCTVAAHGGALRWQGHAALLTQSLDNPAGLTTCPHQSHDYDDESEPPFYTLDGTQTGFCADGALATQGQPRGPRRPKP